MNRYFRHFAALGSVCAIALYSCRVDPVIPEAGGSDTEVVEFTTPQGWPAPHFNFDNNPLTPAGFRLGRKLFFDPVLSRDNSTSCGSCHQPSSAFAQADHQVSHGIEGRLGIRNSPGLFNLAWHSTGLMWDAGVNHLEVQPIVPIENRVEMDETLANVVQKLSANEEYRQLFKAAFGDEEVTSQRMLKSLAQFMAMLVSADSKWDKVQRGSAQFTAEETRGQAVFMANCSRCHTPPLFSDFSLRNNGLPVSNPPDSGRAVITGDASDLYKFKVPSLRNLTYTAPYMHDGSVRTLDAVLEHYSSGIRPVPNLDAGLQNGIQLTANERADLLLFLTTLNDESFIRDTRFAER